nr:SDR family oxidoreductase [uncultured Halomonas sp.]
MIDLSSVSVVSSRLSGKHAVISGGSSGIGLETARQYLLAGARVIVTGRSEPRLKDAEKQLNDVIADARIGTEKSRVLAVQADVRTDEGRHALTQAVEHHFDGRLDVLFANAGMGNFAPIADITPELYDEQFDINVRGVFFTVQSMLPFLVPGSTVILNASAVNQKGAAAGSIYFATKAAVRSFARSFAAELAERGIRVNALSPGVVRTHFQASSNIGEDASESFIQAVVSAAPLKREGLPWEIAHPAVFLASDESAYMTGADLVVDGGWMNV